jgi:spore coat polysaccharide biosynthesis predicted glycosyltransferase SpsG
VSSIGFRADASADIGYGHVVRSAALAAALKDRHGVESHLWTRTPVRLELGIEQRTIPGSVALGFEAEWIADQADLPAVFVLDLCRPSTEQIAGYGRPRPWKLVCIDDETQIRIPCDISVNPSLAELRPHLARQTGRYFTGGSYLLLRRQFGRPPAREIRPLPAELLVCFGGADAFNLSGRVVTAWSQSWPRCVRRVTLVVGPGYEEKHSLLRMTDRDPRWRILCSATDMAGLMRDADAGVFTASTLLYEALSTGLPALFISVNDGQREEAREAARVEAGVDLGFANDMETPRLAEALSGLLMGDREAVSRRAQGLVDGLGCERVADEIARLRTP